MFMKGQSLILEVWTTWTPPEHTKSYFLTHEIITLHGQLRASMNEELQMKILHWVI